MDSSITKFHTLNKTYIILLVDKKKKLRCVLKLNSEVLLQLLLVVVQNSSLILGLHKLDQIDNAVGVTILIVVPKINNGQYMVSTCLIFHNRIIYQEISLTNFSFNGIPALASKIDEWLSPIKSDDTTSSSV